MKTPQIQETEVIAPLPLEERNMLLNLEEKAEAARGIAQDNFKLFGKILFEICERKLYRGEYTTFGAYVQARWKLSRSRAYQIIDARETYELLSNVVDIPTEAANRELSGLSKEEKIEAAKDLKESGEPVTAKTVKAAAMKVSKKKQEAEKKRQEREDAKAKKRAEEIAKREAKEKAKRDKSEPKKARGGLAAEIARAKESQNGSAVGKTQTLSPEAMIREWWKSNKKKLAKAKAETIVKKIIELFA